VSTSPNSKSPKAKYIPELALMATSLVPLRVLNLQGNASVVAYIRKQGGPKRELFLLDHRGVHQGMFPGTHAPDVGMDSGIGDARGRMV
jgi:hypothetical protein